MKLLDAKELPNIYLQDFFLKSGYNVRKIEICKILYYTHVNDKYLSDGFNSNVVPLLWARSNISRSTLDPQSGC